MEKGIGEEKKKIKIVVPPAAGITGDFEFPGFRNAIL